jgi:hypothetical protein
MTFLNNFKLQHKHHLYDFMKKYGFSKSSIKKYILKTKESLNLKKKKLILNIPKKK